MNIFYLSHDPKECAEWHMDRHSVKMILEYAQLLSTAHRVLDGVELSGLSASGRKTKFWTLPDSRDYALYKATHIHHPSAVWVRQSDANYAWLYRLFGALMDEYTYRYGKTHACEKLSDALSYRPKNILKSGFTEPIPAMPNEVKIAGDSIKSYRNYYINNKMHLASWKKRSPPGWYNANL
jgi:hypothetical protein